MLIKKAEEGLQLVKIDWIFNSTFDYKIKNG